MSFKRMAPIKKWGKNREASYTEHLQSGNWHALYIATIFFPWKILLSIFKAFKDPGLAIITQRLLHTLFHQSSLLPLKIHAIEVTATFLDSLSCLSLRLDVNMLKQGSTIKAIDRPLPTLPSSITDRQTDSREL